MTRFAAFGIVARAARRPAVLGNRIGAVERIVEAAPARVGSVQRVARIHHRHDELRAGDLGDLRIDVRGRDREVGSLRQQVSDPLQEGLVFGEIEVPPAPFAVPAIDLRLQAVALGQKRPVLGREVVGDAVQPRPEHLSG